MTVKITFEFAEAQAAAELLNNYLDAQSHVIDPPLLETVSAPPPANKRAGRKSKAVKDAETALKPELGAAAVAPTIIEVRAALNKVAGTSLGLNGAVGVVAEFEDAKGKKCRRVASLQPGDYARVIARCEAQAAA